MQSAKDKTLVDCGTETKVAGGQLLGRQVREKYSFVLSLTEVQTLILAFFNSVITCTGNKAL